MSFSNEIHLYTEGNILNSTRRFNQTFSIFDKFKHLNTYEIESKRMKKNIKSSLNYKKILSHDIIKRNQNYLYNHRSIFNNNYQNKKSKKEKNDIRFKTFEVKNNLFREINSLHKNVLRNKLIGSNLYKLIQKNAYDNYIRAKKERGEKKTFLTMIEQDNLEDNKNIFYFDKPEETPITREKKKDKDNIYFNTENNEKKTNVLKYKNDIIQNPYKKNSMLLKFNKNIKIIKKSYNKTKNIFNKLDNNTSDIKKENYNEIYLDNNNKSLDYYKMKPISIPCIKFNNILDNYFKYILGDYRNSTTSVAKKVMSKLKYAILSKEQLEKYTTTLENNELPKIIADNMYRYFKKGQKYYFEYDDLYKKYLSFLSVEIIKNKFDLNNLIETKENLFKNNLNLLKKISELKEKLKTYDLFKKLFLRIKYKSKNLDDIPIEEMYKYGIITNNNIYHKNTLIYKKDGENKSSNIKTSPRKSLRNNSHLFNKRSPHKLTRAKTVRLRNVPINKNINLDVPSQLPVFEEVDEFFAKFGEEYDAIFKKFESYNKSFYEKTKLEFDFKKESENQQSKDSDYNYNIIKRTEIELFYLKEKNKKLVMFKNKLLGKKLINKRNQIILENDKTRDKKGKKEKEKEKQNIYDKNIIEKSRSNDKNKKKNIDNSKKEINYQNEDYVLEENDKTIALFKIYKKVKQILLNPEINIEKILEKENLYNIIKEPKTKKNIRFNGQLYSKEVLCIKLLELLYLKLIIWKKICLKNNYLRKLFLKLEYQREKELKLYKARQKTLLQKINIIKRNGDTLNKVSKIVFSQDRRNDPFHKKYIYDKLMKQKLKNKNKNNKSETESESED